MSNGAISLGGLGRARRTLERMTTLAPTDVRGWFAKRFGAPTDAQVEGWPSIFERRDVLLAAPTGSGKTLAAFLVGLDSLVREAEAGTLDDRIAHSRDL